MLEWHDLNARHEATFLWVATMLVIAVARSADVRRSVYDLLKMLLKPDISLLIVGLLTNVTVLTTIAVIVGREVGIWETLPIVTAIVWALTTGFSLLLHLEEFLKGDNAFRKRVVTLSRVPGSGVRGRGSGERETTASSLAGKDEPEKGGQRWSGKGRTCLS